MMKTKTPRKISPRKKTVQRKSDSKKTVKKNDGMQNVITGLGRQGKDKRLGVVISAPTNFTQNELTDLYAGDEFAAKVAELPAEEMTRQGFKLKTDDPEISDAVMMKMDELEVLTELTEALIWSRVYGGSVVILGVDDGQEDMTEPLNMDNIKSFEWMTVLDRYEIDIHSYYTDPLKPNFGKPLLYKVHASDKKGRAIDRQKLDQGLIHESRLIKFDGVLTPKRRKRARNSGWADGVFTRLWTVLRDFNMTWDSAAHLMQDFSQATLLIKGLEEMLAQDEDGLVLARIDLIDQCRGVSRIVPLDDGEEFKREATPMTGLPEMIDKFLERFAGAAGMPLALLMGQSPGGLNTSNAGNADIVYWYDKIKAQQNKVLKKALNIIIEILFRAKSGPTAGKEPDEWLVKFNPLWQADEKETSETRLNDAKSDEIGVRNGWLDGDEVANSRWGGDEYGTEIKLNMEAREGMAAVDRQTAQEEAIKAGVAEEMKKIQQAQAMNQQTGNNNQAE